MNKKAKIAIILLISIIALTFPFATLTFSMSCSDKLEPIVEGTELDRFCIKYQNQDMQIQMAQWGFPLPFILDTNTMTSDDRPDFIDLKDDFSYLNYFGNVLITFTLASLIVYPIIKSKK